MKDLGKMGSNLENQAKYLVGHPPLKPANKMCSEGAIITIASEAILETLEDDAEHNHEPHNAEEAILPGLNAMAKGRNLPADREGLMQNAAFSLYCAKFLQAWGDRMWIFSIPILLLELRRPPLPALFLPALYGFCSGASTILFGPIMGEWVDHVSRLHAAKVATICQNGLIGGGGISLAAIIYFKNDLSDVQLFLCIATLMIISFASNIFYAVLTISAYMLTILISATILVIEKDWVAVIAHREKGKLARTISAIRRIELTSNVICPLVMAQIMTYAGGSGCALVIGVWSLCSLFAEYFVLRRTWKLAQSDMRKCLPEKTKKRKPLIRKLCKSCFAIYEGWSIFINNKVCLAGLGVAFLEATVLIFSGVTSGYAIELGFSKTAVALLAGGDAMSGIISTFIFPALRSRTSLERIGLFAMLFHFFCGGICVASNWLPGSPFDPSFLSSENLHLSDEHRWNVPSTALSEESSRNFTGLSVSIREQSDMTSLVVFSVALTVGRLAFWMIDLAGSQLLLENIRDEERGTVCAVHYSLKKLMNRVKYVLAMFLAWPQTFGFLIIASQLFSMVGYGFFIAYSRRNAVKPIKIHNVRRRA